MIRKRFSILRSISSDELTIESKPMVKYLNSKMNFFIFEMKAAADKAGAGISALSRLISNVRGPISTRRRLLMNATHVLPYGAEVYCKHLV